MDDDERETLLRRVNRQGATVGASMPETIAVGDEELPLREFVIETRKIDRLPPDTEETLTAAKRALREERARRVERLESAPLDRDAAEELAGEITGIDRALNALGNVRKPTYSESERNASIDDHKRWLGFLKTIRD